MFSELFFKKEQAEKNDKTHELALIKSLKLFVADLNDYNDGALAVICHDSAHLKNRTDAMTVKNYLVNEGLMVNYHDEEDWDDEATYIAITISMNQKEFAHKLDQDFPCEVATPSLG